MPDDPAALGSPGGGAPQRPEGGPGPRVLERLDERECLQLIGAGRLGRLAYSGRFGPTVLPVLYKLHEGSIVFRTLQDTFTEEDLRTGIAHAEYQVAFEVDQYDPETLDGWVVLVVAGASCGHRGRARADHQRRGRPVARGRIRAPGPGAAHPHQRPPPAPTMTPALACWSP